MNVAANPLVHGEERDERKPNPFHILFSPIFCELMCRICHLQVSRIPDSHLWKDPSQGRPKTNDQKGRGDVAPAQVWPQQHVPLAFWIRCTWCQEHPELLTQQYIPLKKADQQYSTQTSGSTSSSIDLGSNVQNYDRTLFLNLLKCGALFLFPMQLVSHSVFVWKHPALINKLLKLHLYIDFGGCSTEYMVHVLKLISPICLSKLPRTPCLPVPAHMTCMV